MDTGPHFSITALALQNIQWFPQNSIVLKAVQAFNWFPDFLSIIDIYKIWFFSFGWLDYIPLYVPTYGFTEFRSYQTYTLIKSLSKDTLAGKYFHQCHFDNLFSFTAVYTHWSWLKKLTEEFLRSEMSQIKTFAIIGNSLHAVQDFYAHSNWVEFFNALGFKAADIPIWSEVFFSNELKWRDIREQCYSTGDLPMHTIYTGYYKPEKKIPPFAFHHDDKNNNRRGLNKDKPSRPYFEISYNLAIKESIQWLQLLYKDKILTDEHLTNLQNNIPTKTVKNIEIGWERAQTLSKKTKHWNGRYPFPDLTLTINNINVDHSSPQKYIYGTIIITTSENLRLTKRNFTDAYIKISIKKFNNIIGQTILSTDKNGLAPFKVLLPYKKNFSLSSATNNESIQVVAEYGPYCVSTTVKINENNS